MSTITVLLAEDHLIVREGLRALLRAEEGIQVIGEAENGRQAVELAASLRPNVIVLDIAMPLLNGMEAARQILAAQPDTKILMLSAYNDDTYVSLVMAIGVVGYLIKQTAAHVLPKAIRAVHQGKTYFSPTISLRFEQRLKKARARGEVSTKHNASLLTSREMEVLQLIAEGKANKETAEQLNISIKTVEKHRQNLMDKLNIHDTAGLTRYAIGNGIIESNVQVTII